ncbi:glutamate 5-kinase [Corynebacterium otitidis ATCC 51513]|uniref:Glutamate 5-kinase n=2 Tax=Corynebacterium otitidis TaxID=29321 RepID=I7JVH3_9CORY|nr:glutamate 5-kinase [Corynebacterium otitidis]EJZ82585.1 glutamate 5-kinase [Corynebacterium otitidis ATCC 51513]CCI82836.1 gamma-glutamyl kinase [Corynebacterium otitidis ATCC 51513]
MSSSTSEPTHPDSLPLAPYQGAPDEAHFPGASGHGAAFGHESEMRRRITQAKRIVVKIGSSSLTDENFTVDPNKINRLVDAIQARMAADSDVIMVSSGAVAAGMGPLGLKVRPSDLATKQAAAAVGQVHLAHQWGLSFARYRRTIGQVLLTASDAANRVRARNAQRTIDQLRKMRAVPIVNENDTVATSEMRFGDNDRLAAIVSHLAAADACILLSDVDGLFDRNPADPGAKFISEVRDGNDLKGVVAGDGGAVGTGGMASKVSAARLAARGGVPVLLTSAESIGPALEDAQVGTVFDPRPERLSAWKFWALYAAESKGTLKLDEGAVEAIREGGKSLLPVGVTDVENNFERGQIVDLVGPEGEVVGRGEVNFGSDTLNEMKGKRTENLPPNQRRSVIHVDYLADYDIDP